MLLVEVTNALTSWTRRKQGEVSRPLSIDTKETGFDFAENFVYMDRYLWRLKTESHSFALTPFRHAVWCSHCETIILGLHCYECHVCGYIVHKKCKKKVVQECWDIPKNFDLNGRPITKPAGSGANPSKLHSEECISSYSKLDTFMAVLTEGNPRMIAYMVHQLSACKSDEINAQDRDGNTILHLAAMGEVSVHIFRIALKCSKINCSIANKDGNTPLHYLCQYCSTPESAELCEVLLTRGANVNQPNFIGETPLHKAMFNKNVRFLLVEPLVRYGADVNIQNVAGDTALHYAVRLNRVDLVQFVLRHGAVSKAGKENKTPSQLALEYNLFDIKRTIDGVQDVHAFLEGLGLEVYKNQFIDAEIKLPGVMSVFSPGLLERLGVRDPDHKMKLLQNGTQRKVHVSANAEPILQRINEQHRTDRVYLNSDSWIIHHNELEFVKKLGMGANATVFSGIFLKNRVAIKVMDKEMTETPKEFVKELSIMCKIMSQTPSARVIKLYGAVLEPRLSLVMELAANGSLYHLIKNRKTNFDWTLFFKFSIQTCQGMAYMHKLDPPILHRDLKTLNLMVTESMEIKVGDFGLSKYSNDRTYSGIKGTAAYLAPELIKGANFSTKTDVYSMGIVMWELAYRTLYGEYMEPYENVRANGLQLLYKVAVDGVRPPIPPTCPPEVRDIINRCLSVDVIMRPDFLDLEERLKVVEKIYQNNRVIWETMCQVPSPSPMPSPSLFLPSSPTATFTSESFSNFSMSDVRDKV